MYTSVTRILIVILCILFRLDFDQFNIAGPEPINHMCNNDQFIVAGGNPAPTICGINTGNHSEYTAIKLILRVLYQLFYPAVVVLCITSLQN
jgi:hypothetical protein